MLRWIVLFEEIQNKYFVYLKNSKTIYHVWFIIDKAKLLQAIRNQCFFNLFGHALAFGRGSWPGVEPTACGGSAAAITGAVKDVLDICLRVLPAFLPALLYVTTPSFFCQSQWVWSLVGELRYKWSNWAYMLQLLTCRPAQWSESCMLLTKASKQNKNKHLKNK